MKKDSFGQFIALHIGYVIGYMIVVAFIAVASTPYIPEAFWLGVGLLILMSLATYFGYKKWKKNQ